MGGFESCLQQCIWQTIKTSDVSKSQAELAFLPGAFPSVPAWHEGCYISQALQIDILITMSLEHQSRSPVEFASNVDFDFIQFPISNDTTRVHVIIMDFKGFFSFLQFNLASLSITLTSMIKRLKRPRKRRN